MSRGSAKSDAEALISKKYPTRLNHCVHKLLAKFPGFSKDSENRAEAYASLKCENLSRAGHVKCY